MCRLICNLPELNIRICEVLYLMALVQPTKKDYELG